jgi:hypothetical protein
VRALRRPVLQLALLLLLPLLLCLLALLGCWWLHHCCCCCWGKGWGMTGLLLLLVYRWLLLAL